MVSRLRLTILGCGSSPGTPRVTGDWGACDPAEPRNRRTRCAALIERFADDGQSTVIAIDCGPDFRQQMLSAEVRRLDAVVVTHPHADHIHGLDDVRSYFLDQRRPVDLYADQQTHARLIEAFGYCFHTPPGSSYPPIVRHRPIEAGIPFRIEGPGGAVEWLPFDQQHGSITSLGFRIGPLAYCSDVSDFPRTAVEVIQGAQTLVIDALQYRPHPSHLSLSETLEWIDRLGVENGILTHMHTPLDYRTMLAELPAHVKPGYDGMTIEFTGPEWL